MKNHYVCQVFRKIYGTEPAKCLERKCNKLQEYTPDEIKVLLRMGYKFTAKKEE
jgi:hypothetical protein